jgi:hypothetical protein
MQDVCKKCVFLQKNIYLMLQKCLLLYEKILCNALSYYSYHIKAYWSEQRMDNAQTQITLKSVLNLFMVCV